MILFNKWLAMAFLVLAVIPVYYAIGQDNITIDNIQLGTWVINDDISLDDLQGHVVGVKYMGKW